MGPATPLLAAAAAVSRSSNRTPRLEMRKRAAATEQPGMAEGGVFVFT